MNLDGTTGSQNHSLVKSQNIPVWQSWWRHQGHRRDGCWGVMLQNEDWLVCWEEALRFKQLMFDCFIFPKCNFCKLCRYKYVVIVPSFFIFLYFYLVFLTLYYFIFSIYLIKVVKINLETFKISVGFWVNVINGYKCILFIYISNNYDVIRVRIQSNPSLTSKIQTYPISKFKIQSNPYLISKTRTYLISNS